jgi:hypothetical protein
MLCLARRDAGFADCMKFVAYKIHPLATNPRAANGLCFISRTATAFFNEAVEMADSFLRAE